MITLTREEAQQVLDALEQLAGWDTATQGDIVFDPSDEIETLRARLAQPETEPVAWFTEDHREDKSATTYSKKMSERWKEKGWPVTPLYTAPPQREWQGLTDKEIMDACAAVWASHPIDVARIIEAKLREKNT